MKQEKSIHGAKGCPCPFLDAMLYGPMLVCCTKLWCSTPSYFKMCCVSECVSVPERGVTYFSDVTLAHFVFLCFQESPIICKLAKRHFTCTGCWTTCVMSHPLRRSLLRPLHSLSTQLSTGPCRDLAYLHYLLSPSPKRMKQTQAVRHKEISNQGPYFHATAIRVSRIHPQVAIDFFSALFVKVWNMNLNLLNSASPL